MAHVVRRVSTSAANRSNAARFFSVKSTHSSGAPSGVFARKNRGTGAICRSDADAASVRPRHHPCRGCRRSRREARPHHPRPFS